MPVLTGSVHAHILTKPSRDVFAVIRLELIEPGAETCVHNEARPKERSDRGRFIKIIFLYQGCFSVCFIIVIGHLRRPYSTHAAPMPVLTGSVHAHILTRPSCAGFAVIRLELIEPGAETCVYQAKSCSPTDQPVYRSACPEI